MSARRPTRAAKPTSRRLTNGTLKFINVTGNTAEIANTTTRATNITSGTAFTLSGTSSTVFSRPEDGAWDPTTPGRFYFVTTDRLDQVADGVGSQIGRTRLWRLNFTDITNPDLGGTIDLVLTGGVGNDANMWDNMCVAYDGKVMLQEDVGGAAHNGKIWSYDPVTNILTKVVMHDPARFGDILSGGTALPAISPFNNDEESSGIIDVTALLDGSAAAGEHVYFAVSQAHYTTGITAAQVEGGQLLVIRETPRVAFSLAASTNTVNENAGSVTLTVNRYGDLQFGGTATISTTNGTALAGTDYAALSGFSMTFAPGETAKAVNVAIANRSGAQPDRSFTASLTGASRGSPSTTTVTIIDTTTTAFAAWLAANGYAGTLGADSDNDGTPDVLEYFFNSSPNNPADRAHLPAIVRQGADLEFRFTRLQSSTLTGTLRYSTDLLTWQNAVQGVDFEIVSQTVSSGEVEVRYRILNPINAKFFQLRVE
ncbi:MAG: Calx-beta domain-containing protein [Verrucomicrobiaceae bacterium]